MMKLRALGAAMVVALTLPAIAHAGVTYIAKISGVAGAGAYGQINSGDGFFQTSFAGDPVNVWLEISSSHAGLYVSAFTMDWAPTHPYTGIFATSFYEPGYPGFSAPGLPPQDDPFDAPVGFFSNIRLGAVDHLDLGTNYAFGGRYDSGIGLTADFAPDAPGGGSGEIGLSVNGFGGNTGTDAWANVPFMITSASVSPAPEPATWAMMLVGFFGLGAALRRRRLAD